MRDQLAQYSLPASRRAELRERLEVLTSIAERAEVKKVARDLLARIKELLVLNWRKKTSARAQLRLEIENILEEGLPVAYTDDLYQGKRSAVFQHVYEKYPERNEGIYSVAV